MIRRFFATKDNTITNAFKEDLVTRGTGSNMGAADILEVFSIYAQASDDSSELTRFLIQFDESEISSMRSANSLPAAGEVSWYLRLFNAPHSQPLPSSFSLEAKAISAEWEEGFGMDLENYEDITLDGIGSNWINRAEGETWSSPGGDYHATPTFTAEFETGLEDLDLEVTDLVEEWLDGTKTNYGFIIKLTDALEGTSRSYYTKRFFGKDSQFFFRRPILEARWNDSRRDDRGCFYASSSLVSANENLNTLYLYNHVRGRLRDYPVAPTSASIRLSADTPIVGASASVGRVSTGIYSASIAFDTTASTVYDVWYSGSTAYHTGTVSVKSFSSDGYNPASEYVLSMPKLKNNYKKDQTFRMDLYVREKNWSPNIYTVATQTSIPSLIVPSASYQVKRSIDDHIVIDYGTGSTGHTILSYDVSGNYFHLDTTSMEPGYLYKLHYSFYDEVDGWQEQPYSFKFRVVQ
jgi:hypothetical protein